MYHSLKVSQVEPVTAEAVTVKFEIPSELAPQFKFKPGQFLGVKTMINGEEIRRSYSICSSVRSGEWQVAIKRVKGGKFSTWATQNLSAGMTLEVAEPAGRFTVNCMSNHERNYVFVAAGSGITPVMSMIKSILIEEPLSKMILIYGNQSPAQTLFKNELESLSEQYSDRFTVKFFNSRSGSENLVRISSELIAAEVSSVFDWSNIYGVYLCGPQPMIEAAKSSLPASVGIAEDQIKFELFQIDSKEGVAAANTDFEKSKVTVNIDEVDYTFEVEAGANILSAGLEAGIDIPYSCQGGVCGTCECTVEEGEVELAQNMVLSDDEVQEGQALACQAVPKTAEVKLYFGF